MWAASLIASTARRLQKICSRPKPVGLKSSQPMNLVFAQIAATNRRPAVPPRIASHDIASHGEQHKRRVDDTFLSPSTKSL